MRLYILFIYISLQKHQNPQFVFKRLQFSLEASISETSTFLPINIFEIEFFLYQWLLGYYKANRFFRNIFRELKYTDGNTSEYLWSVWELIEPSSPHTSTVAISKDRRRESGPCSYLHGSLVFSTHERLWVCRHHSVQTSHCSLPAPLLLPCSELSGEFLGC